MAARNEMYKTLASLTHDDLAKIALSWLQNRDIITEAKTSLELIDIILDSMGL